MADTATNQKQLEKSLLRNCGSTRAEKQLEQMKRQLRQMNEPISSPKNPTFHNLHRKASEVLGESARLRTKAMQAMAEKKTKYYKQRISDTIPELEEELHRIENFPEQVGSKKTKDRLLQMRKTIYDHRIQLDMAEHHLNEGKLSDEIKVQRAIEKTEMKKRREAKKKETGWRKKRANPGNVGGQHRASFVGSNTNGK